VCFRQTEPTQQNTPDPGCWIFGENFELFRINLELNKANTSDTSVAFLDLDLSIENGVVSKIYDKGTI